MEELDKFLDNTKNFNLCQRNWDYNKTIEHNTIKKLIDIAYATPSKQSLQNFTLVAITDRNIIEHLENASVSDEDWPDAIKQRFEQGQKQNPQVNANVLFVYLYKHEDEDLKLERQFNNNNDKTTVDIEIGISSGALGLAANQIGLRTGFCRCIDTDMIDSDIFPYNTNDIVMFLGVGYPLHTEEFPKFPKHTIHNNTDFYNKSYPKGSYDYNII